jgi:hypothetical protein
MQFFDRLVIFYRMIILYGKTVWCFCMVIFHCTDACPSPSPHSLLTHLPPPSLVLVLVSVLVLVLYIYIYIHYIYIYIYDFLHVTRTKLKQLYVWYCTNELYIQLYVCLPLYIYISYIKCNVVTVYERILICFIIYRNAILTFLTLFDKYVFEKKL